MLSALGLDERTVGEQLLLLLLLLLLLVVVFPFRDEVDEEEDVEEEQEDDEVTAFGTFLDSFLLWIKWQRGP